MGGKYVRGGVPEDAYQTINHWDVLVVCDSITNENKLYSKCLKELKNVLIQVNRTSIVEQVTCDEDRYEEMKAELEDAVVVDELASLDRSKVGSVGEFAVINMQDARLDDEELYPEKYANDKKKVGKINLVCLLRFNILNLLTY